MKRSQRIKKSKVGLRKWIIFLFFFTVSSALQAEEEPVRLTWTPSVVKKESGWTLRLTGKLEPSWHIYGVDRKRGEGPVPTQVTFQGSGEAYELVGDLAYSKPKRAYEEGFGKEISYYEGGVVFEQKIQLKQGVSEIKGSVTYMLCNHKVCLPPRTESFSFDVSEIPISSRRGLWTLFLISFFSGFAALLTPCVFPVIPLTIGFFVKQETPHKKGLRSLMVYGGSIIFIYTFLGWLVSSLFGAFALNQIATSVWLNLFFFLLLVVFAISFLGGFVIRLPSSWMNFLDRQASHSKYFGNLFLAMMLVVTSFSCTGPIMGTLLVQAAGQSWWAPILGMFGFSLALALAFVTLALSPRVLKSLPKSGGWLEGFKISLGFLELAFAFKFLSNVDLVLQTNWLTRDVFILIWLAIFIVLTLFILGFFSISHSPLPASLSVFRLLVSMVSLFFVLYLSQGLKGQELKLLSGLLPPVDYSQPVALSDFRGPKKEEIWRSVGAHGVPLLHDYDLALSQAKREGKPVLLIFSGHACANCRRMEAYAWLSEEVLEILKKKVVVLMGYVDGRRKVSDGKGGFLTEGEKWSTFEVSRFGRSTQPYYVMLDEKGKELGGGLGYTVHPEELLEWLQRGLQKQ